MSKDEMIAEIANLMESCPSDTCGEFKDCRACYAKAIINLGYRKIAEDEIVITNDEYKKLRSAKLTYESEVFRIALEKIAQSERETARKILLTIYTYLKGAMTQQTTALMTVKELAEHYGIELEKNNEQRQREND